MEPLNLDRILSTIMIVLQWIAMDCYRVELPNNGHSGDRPLVHCREVVPISEGNVCMLQSVGGKQFVCSTEVVCFSECPYTHDPPHPSPFTLLTTYTPNLSQSSPLTPFTLLTFHTPHHLHPSPFTLLTTSTPNLSVLTTYTPHLSHSHYRGSWCCRLSGKPLPSPRSSC